MLIDSNVIAAAAGSALGVRSLMVLVLSSLALAFFRDTTPPMKLTVFFLMFAGHSHLQRSSCRRSATRPGRPRAVS
jgi:hypothetical protein